GSKVTTAGVAPDARAWALRRSRIARCPRCTPSKFPMVTARGASACSFIAAPSKQHHSGPKPGPLPAVDGEEAPVGVEHRHGATGGAAGIGIAERPAMAHRAQVLAGDGHRLVVAQGG